MDNVTGVFAVGVAGCRQMVALQRARPLCFFGNRLFQGTNGDRTHVYDYSLAVVMVVCDGVEVVLARVLRVLVNSAVLVGAELRKRPAGKTKRENR